MNSKVITPQGKKTVSRLVTAMQEWSKDYSEKPSGLFGFSCVIKIGGVITINNTSLDVDFDVPFDDDMEANEAEIIVYNLADSTIKNIKKDAKVTIEAGYDGDTGVIFSGDVTSVKTKYEDVDKVTTIKALDDVSEKTVESLAFAAGTKASYILKTLLNKTGTPIAVFKIRRDHTYENETTVDGDLIELIKKYAEVCGVSVFVSKGKIYARHIKLGDNLNFELSADTGLIGSPTEFTEEVTAEDFTETVNGYTVKSLLQHRMTTAGIIKIKSKQVSGEYRIRSGRHSYNKDSGAVTEIEVV